MNENVEISIDGFNSRGWGVGSYQSAISSTKEKIEIVGGVPGDRVFVRLSRKRRGKRRGELLEILEPSAYRVSPRCQHVPLCGGCTWQQFDYSSQLQEKQERLEQLFVPLLNTQTFQICKIIPCAEPWYYRNKMEFSFSQNLAGEKFLGLVIAGSKGHVLNLSECHLVSKLFIRILNEVRAWWEKSGLLAYRRNNKGTLRTLIIREGKNTSDKLVMLTVSGNPEFAIHKSQLNGFIEAIKASIPEQEWPHLSIFLRVQQIHKGSPTQFFELHLYGPDHMLEKMHIDAKLPLELTFKISPTSFFQPNTQQAQRLYSQALKLVQFPKKHVLDLYAGTATLAIAMSSHAKKVTAIELNPHACFDAEMNKELNRCDHLRIICGDVGKKLEELRKEPDFIPPDLVIIDPPRTGLDNVALNHLKDLNPEEILYISCNPESQVANIQTLCLEGYQIVVVQPVDQFPHTPHIENIVLLKRKIIS